MSRRMIDEALQRAQFHTKRGEAAEAIKALEMAMQSFPKNQKLPNISSDLFQKKSLKNDTKAKMKAIEKLRFLFNEGNFEIAINEAETILRNDPLECVAWSILGGAAAQVRSFDKAVAAFKKVIAIEPSDARGYNNLGNVLVLQRKLNEAVKYYETALIYQPDYFEALKNMGTVYQMQGNIDSSIEFFQKALNVNPNCAEIHVNMGVGLQQQGKISEAIGCFKKALAVSPNYPDAYNNLGVAFKEQDDFSLAGLAFDKAIEIDPNRSEYHSNLGVLLHDTGDLDAAIAAYEKALKIEPNNYDIHQKLSFALFNKGRYRQAFLEYECRLKNLNYLSRFEKFDCPMWDGKVSLHDKTILIWHEQGVGDTINWSYYLQTMQKIAKNCIFLCQEKLVALFRRSFPDILVVSSLDCLLGAEYDFQIPMGSLCQHFFESGLSQQKKGPVLKPDPQRIIFWEKRLKLLGEGPYVGVSWKSSKISPSRKENYAPIEEWAPLFTLRDVKFVNLQYIDASDDVKSIKQLFGTDVYCLDDIDHYNNIDDVAALCAALDSVVSTKITVPFIAAGVGTKTKLANWKQSAWNNILSNPIGPHVAIYERETLKPWTATFQLIAEDLSSDLFIDT